MEAQLKLSGHAEQRCRQRGITQAIVEAVMDHHDVDYDIGDDCRLLKVSKSAARSMAFRRQLAEKLPRVAIIWSDRANQVVTVLHISGGQIGRRFRRQH